MSKMGALHFHPERVAWIGSAIVGLGLLTASLFILLFYFEEPPMIPQKIRKEEVKEPLLLNFSLGLSEKALALPIPSLQEQMSFSFDPPRPVGAASSDRILVRMKKSEEWRRVALPCRLDVEFQRDQLVFAKEKSPFWIDLELNGGKIEGRGWIASADGELEAGRFSALSQECPVQGAQEFPEGSPFRILAEAKWLGKDLFREGGGERIEIGGVELLELKEKEWLAWDGQKWAKKQEIDSIAPIARIQSLGSKGLVMEGWDQEGHVRLAYNIAAGAPFKAKPEELFSAIRIRSEKQISCMLEKQCMVLKAGDWVLKTGGRWKILRKKEERDAFLDGKLFGDLFMFEQISQKQGQKVVLGKLFNSGRTQMVPIEIGAQATRKVGDQGRKGHR